MKTSLWGRMTTLNIWQQLKEALVPLSVFWTANIFGFLCFSAAILFLDELSLTNFFALAFVGIVVFGAMLSGQILALLRLRTLWVLIGGGLLFVIGLAAEAGLIGVGFSAGAAFVMVFLILGPIAAWGGMWSMETHRALWSTLVPILWSTGAIFVWIDKMDKDKTWFEGSKWAVWDVVSLGVLGGMLLLLLLYLVSRETHRLALWRRGHNAPLLPSTPDRGATRPRLTLLGGLGIGGMTLVLACGTALIAPYLWRVGPDQGNAPESGPEPTDLPNTTEAPDNAWGERFERFMKQVEQAGERASQAGCASLSILILGGLMFVVGGRPVKRLFLLRHLRVPLWNVSPTTRIEQGWRMVEIAMGDIGVHPIPGEDASGLARRAAPVLQKLSPVEVHGLPEAAEAMDRVRFGLGIGSEDVQIMARFSAWTLDTVWERLSDKEQLRCMYRRL